MLFAKGGFFHAEISILLWNVSNSLVYVGMAGVSSEIQLVVLPALPCKDTWKSGPIVHLRKIPRFAGRKYRFSLQLYTNMHGFKYEFSKFFWVGAHRAPSPDPLPPLNLKLCLRFSGALHPRFGLRPQFTHPTCLITHLPTEGTRWNTVFPKPQLPGYTIGPNISFQDYVVGLIEIYQW